MGGKLRIGCLTLLLCFLLSGCAYDSHVGITRSATGIVVMSGCSEAGVSFVRISLEPEKASTSTTPDNVFEARWQGNEDETPRIVDLSSLDARYAVEGSVPTLELDTPIQILVDLEPGLFYGNSLVITPADLVPGLVFVDRGTETESTTAISESEFLESVALCVDPRDVDRAMAVILAAGASGALLLAAIVIYPRTPIGKRRRAEKPKKMYWMYIRPDPRPQWWRRVAQRGPRSRSSSS
jgi:hypothetical protein